MDEKLFGKQRYCTILSFFIFHTETCECLGFKPSQNLKLSETEKYHALRLLSQQIVLKRLPVFTGISCVVLAFYGGMLGYVVDGDCVTK